ncbi:MAG: GNAT family N-acetyltransferase [Synergistaceae bacterium]|jgi:N-acetylglutamate synthase-like GNAT family acetyltransferase|nr:GNAT family N-acetyltransferase [Synergistaceae bacterium]MDY0284458.1 GNAT family N-acetyltransferase [Synergistaceae bacterium]
MEIHSATENDMTYIFSLLKATDLTTVGIENDPSCFYVCTEETKPVGCFGIVHSSNGAMLRSFAVEPGKQSRGIGRFMAMWSLEHARKNKILPLYLLTETAHMFFRKFGFVEVTRKDIPDVIMDATALGEYCPCTSICMRIDR